MLRTNSRPRTPPPYTIHTITLLTRAASAVTNTPVTGLGQIFDCAAQTDDQNKDAHKHYQCPHRHQQKCDGGNDGCQIRYNGQF